MRQTSPQSPSEPLVILFKSPPSTASSGLIHDNESDKYTQALEPYETTYFPVLTESYTNLERLADVVEDGSGRWEGVIMTSKRAAEAWVEACRLGFRSSNDAGFSGPHGTKEDEEGWERVKVFSPGTSVGDVLSSSGMASSLIPVLEYGQNTDHPAKSASSLLPIIVSTPPRSTIPMDQHTSDWNGNRSGGYRPYLFLTGDKTLSDLPDGLKAAGREVIKMQVYQTAPLDDIESRLSTLTDDKKSRKLWLTFFSPSSSAAVIPHLRKHGIIPRSRTSANTPSKDGDTTQYHGGVEQLREGVRIAVIGETTRRYLVEQGIVVHAVAKTPSAGGLAEVIRSYGSSCL